MVKPIRYLFLAFLALGGSVASEPNLPGRGADIIFLDGAVWTANASRSWATSLAISEGKILYVGPDVGARPFIGPDSVVVWLDGKMVMPGFCDSHTHPVISGVELGQLNLAELPNRPAIEAEIRTYADKHPELPWIVGGGWHLTALPSDLSARDLDELIPDRPAFLATSDAHSAWVNSRALLAAGVDSSTPDPDGGKIERDQHGRPTGLLREAAMALVARHLPAISADDYLQGAIRGLSMAAKFGITTVHEANATPEILQAYATLERQGRLTARVIAALKTDTKLGPEQVETLVDLRQRWSTPLIHPRAAKLFIDGVLESRTAALLEPYSGFPEERGILTWDPQRLSSMVTALDAAGFQIHCHVIGDRAVRAALDALENARVVNGVRDSRHHIAHLQLIDPADLDRFRALGVLANLQPLWAFRDDFIRDLTEPILGPERSALMYPFEDLHKSGAVLVAGSDWSVSSMNPMAGIEVAVSRQDPDKEGEDAWLPEQRLDLPTILAAYTINGASLGFLEHQVGSLEVGKWADLVVLDQNLFELAPAQLSDVKVLLTMLAGKAVYRDPGFTD